MRLIRNLNDDERIRVFRPVVIPVTGSVITILVSEHEIFIECGRWG
jgi:hypothetical protein